MIGTRIAYVLDPQMAVFRQAKLSEGEGFKAIKNEIGSDAIDTLHLDSDHSLFFDDEGLRGSITHYTMLEGHPDPLAGRLLLLLMIRTRSSRDYRWKRLLPDFAVIAPSLTRFSKRQAHRPRKVWSLYLASLASARASKRSPSQ